MEKIYNTLKICILSLLLLGAGGCNNWMDIYPENQQTSDNFWKSKEEVQQVLMGAYTKLRTNLDTIIMWGDLRGDLLKLGANENNLPDHRKIKQLEIDYDNSICKWNQFYVVILRANSVIQRSNSVLEYDITFTQEQSNAYIAEAIFLRSLSYFYLLRTFGEVPLVLEAYTDDKQEYNIPKSSEETILNQLVKDLEEWAPKCKYTYEKDWERTGRATRWAFYSLLAEINLWRANYDETVKWCDRIIESNQFQLVPTEEWFTIFYPGNSMESIFELQWSNQHAQNNDLFKWFFNSASNSNYLVSASCRALFEAETLPDHDDIRGPNSSYLLATSYDSKVWKFAGTGIYGQEGYIRGESQQDANFIIYRYSDIILMKAEALVMKGAGGQQEGIALLNDFRTYRGHVNKQPDPVSQREALLMVLDERSREFIAEGKRWFDILRVSKRDKAYEDYVIEVLLLGVDAKDYMIWKSRLSEPLSWYLPVHRNEIVNSNGVVTQNSYYNETN